AGKRFLCERLIVRRRSLQKNAPRLIVADLDMRHTARFRFRVGAFVADDAGESLTVGVVETIFPIAFELVFRYVAEIVADADGDAGVASRPLTWLIETFVFKDEIERVLRQRFHHVVRNIASASRSIVCLTRGSNGLAISGSFPSRITSLSVISIDPFALKPFALPLKWRWSPFLFICDSIRYF